MFAPTGTLADLVPEARGKVEELLGIATALGLKPRVRGAGRTCAYQASLAAQGSGVTHANLCRSWHVLGRAVDLTLAPDTCDSYTTLGVAWERMGGIWGGRFTGFGECGDAGHYQWADTGAVPTSVCPESTTLLECEAVRRAYLSKAFAPGAGLGAGLLVGGIAAVAAWWWLR